MPQQNGWLLTDVAHWTDIYNQRKIFRITDSLTFINQSFKKVTTTEFLKQKKPEYNRT